MCYRTVMEVSTVSGVTATAVDWLLESDEPGIVFQTKRDPLGEDEPPEAAHRVLQAAK